MISPRAAAAKILKEVIDEQRSLSAVLPKYLEKFQKPQDRAFTQELCFGVLRWYFQLTPVAQKILHSPLKTKDHDIFYLLLIGLYQLAQLNMPDYAAVSETVNAARDLKKPWAAGLLNKLLRVFLTHKENFLAANNQTESRKYAHPDWLIDMIKTAWPSQWTAILTANNEHPPMTLRINTQKISRENYSQQLTDHHIEHILLENSPEAIQLSNPVPISELPGFSKGFCYIQDASGQYAAHLLDVEKDHLVLDACAAPGSKTTHILTLQPHLKKIIAIDQDRARLALVKDNVIRLGLNKNLIELIATDAAQTSWFKGEKFDRILLDAPCSATGIIRRHPDIKLLRKASDITQYPEKQLTLLNALWPLLKENGILLYSTCSILPAENDAVITQFLQSQKNASTVPITLKNAINTHHGQQLLPENNQDGFYYAKLKKN